MRDHDLRIDLIKLIATAMVVVLHTIESGEYVHQCLYLLGTFGIPLFLTVNGYLMYERDVNLSYFKTKLIRYLRFVLVWSLIIGLAESILEQKFMFLDVFLGAWFGKGRLFHLWFITTILLIMCINCLVNFIFKQHDAKFWLLSIESIVVFIILMNILFLFNTFIFYTGSLIIAPFRLLTNGSFYIFGMYLHNKRMPIKTNILICTFITGYVAICALSIILSIKWASAMYTSIFCVASVVSMTVFCLQLKITEQPFWRFIHFATPATIGIWITHPFVIAIIKKVLVYIGFEITLPIRILMVPSVILICLVGVKFALKIKGIRMLFKI